MKLDPAWLLEGLTEAQIKGVIKVGWRGLLVGHILWACGWASYIGLSGGFALAEDVNRLKEEYRSKRVSELTTELLDVKAKHCIATGEAWTLYYKAYNELRAEYYQLARREFPDPPCDNFK